MRVRAEQLRQPRWRRARPLTALTALLTLGGLGQVSAAVADGGVYQVLNACGNKALDVRKRATFNGAALQTWDYGGGPNQHWIFRKVGEYFVITAQHSGKVLDAEKAGSKPGTRVAQWQDSGADNQLWKVNDIGGGQVSLSPKYAPKLHLDVAGASAGNAGQLQLWEANRSCAQRWTLGQVSAEKAYRLSVSPDGRSIVRSDGQPFFYLGDTAWELFHRLNRAQIRQYLHTRQVQGFNVVQAVALAEIGGLSVPNAYHDLPLNKKNPAKPAVTPGADPGKPAEYDYWDHLDYAVNEAAARGMYVALLPTWGVWAQEKNIFTAASARAYGRFLGERYRNKPIIWVLGGDRVPNKASLPIWKALAEGVETGAGGRGAALISFHPAGRHGSAEWFHHEPWLDFNMWQSGQCLGVKVWEQISSSYQLKPIKPVLNAEAIYEDHPVCQDAASKGYSQPADVRNAAYWSVFAGAFGHAYGHHAVWQMHTDEQPGRNGPRSDWRDALNAPVAKQMHMLRALMEARPMLGRVPDQSLLTEAYSGTDRAEALRGKNHALFYSASGKPLKVRLERLPGQRFKATWFDPRTGRSTPAGTVGNKGNHTFTPPSQGRGNDWVLILDDASRNYPPVAAF